jgi:hypothetical protein
MRRMKQIRRLLVTPSEPVAIEICTDHHDISDLADETQLETSPILEKFRYARGL